MIVECLTLLCTLPVQGRVNIMICDSSFGLPVSSPSTYHPMSDIYFHQSNHRHHIVSEKVIKGSLEWKRHIFTGDIVCVMYVERIYIRLSLKTQTSSDKISVYLSNGKNFSNNARLISYYFYLQKPIVRYSAIFPIVIWNIIDIIRFIVSFLFYCFGRIFFRSSKSRIYWTTIYVPENPLQGKNCFQEMYSWLSLGLNNL